MWCSAAPSICDLSLHGHGRYGAAERGASGNCSSRDWRYRRQPRRNSGHVGTVGSGSVGGSRVPADASGARARCRPCGSGCPPQAAAPRQSAARAPSCRDLRPRYLLAKPLRAAADTCCPPNSIWAARLPANRSRDHRSTRRVLQDGGYDKAPRRWGQFVAGPFQHEQLGTADLLLQRECMAERKHGILCTMDDERRRIYFCEPIPGRTAYVHDEVVHLAGRYVDRALELTAHKVTHRRFIEVARPSREYSEKSDNVVDHGCTLRPIRAQPAHVGKELLRHGRKAGTARACPDQG